MTDAFLISPASGKTPTAVDCHRFPFTQRDDGIPSNILRIRDELGAGDKEGI